MFSFFFVLATDPKVFNVFYTKAGAHHLQHDLIARNVDASWLALLVEARVTVDKANTMPNFEVLAVDEGLRSHGLVRERISPGD